MKMVKLVVCAVLGAGLSVLAEPLALNPIFTDHMVVAEGQSLRVFGTGEGMVSVAFRGAKAQTASKGGAWCVELPAGAAGGPFTLEVDLGGAKRTLADVHVGEVLVMAGQSNLQFMLRETGTKPETWQGNPLIRSYALPRPEAGAPFGPKDGWVPLTQANAGSWSAVGYYVALQRAAKRPGVAIGVVSCFQGASTIQGWMPAALANDPKFKSADVCESNNIHPKTKSRLSERIAATIPNGKLRTEN